MGNENESDYRPEKKLIGNINSINKKQMKRLLSQMEKNICKIDCNDGSKGTGFFCKIPFPDYKDYKNPLKVLITNNHVISQEDINLGKKIDITINDGTINKSICINEDRLAYTFEKPDDVTFIEIKESDNIDPESYIELDENIFDINKINSYSQKTVYLLHYPNGDNAELSLGKIKGISLDNYKIEHYCESQTGSSGSPIINLTNFKVIGVHKGAFDNTKKNFNIGIFLKGPIEKLYQKHKENENVHILKISENINIINRALSVKKIIKLMEKKSFCKIIKSNQIKGTGFLCHIPCPNIINGKIPTLITCNNILSENEILKGSKVNFSLREDTDYINTITIDESRKVLSIKKSDFTIIEIKPTDNIKSNYFLEIDEVVLNSDNFSQYLKNTPILLIGLNRNLFYSQSIIKDIKNFYLIYYCGTVVGSTGCPLINLANNKVIGMNLYIKNNANIGIVIKYLVKEYLKIFLNE